MTAKMSRNERNEFEIEIEGEGLTFTGATEELAKAGFAEWIRAERPELAELDWTF